MLSLFYSSASEPAADLRWQRTPLYKNESSQGNIEALMLRRNILAPVPFQVATITYYKVSKSHLKDGSIMDAKKVAEGVRDALGIKDWKAIQIGRSQTYFGHWKSTNRYVRFFITETKDDVAYSFAIFRSAYADSLVPEIELIQRKLAGEIKSSPNWLQRLLASALIPVARADHHCGTCAATDQTCLETYLECNQAELIEDLSDATVDLDTLLGTSDEKLMGKIDTANSNWAETNEILSDLTNPVVMAGVGAATAAGAAAGALVFSAGINLLGAIGAGFIELVTKAERNEDLLERFKAARELWEQQIATTLNLEAEIDKLLRELDTYKGENLTREALVTRVNSRKSHLEDLRDQLEGEGGLVDLLARTRTDPSLASCRLEVLADITHIKEQMIQIEKVIANYETVIGLEKNYSRGGTADSWICSFLADKYGKIQQAEGELQRARATIAGAEFLFWREWREEQKTMREDFRLGRVKTKKTEKQRRKAAEESRASWSKTMEQIQEQWVDRCIKGVKATASATRESQCTRLYYESVGIDAYEDNKDSEYTRRARRDYAAAHLASEFETNPGLREKASASMGEERQLERWFRAIRAEQNCLVNPESGCDSESAKRVKTLKDIGNKISLSCPGWTFQVQSGILPSDFTDPTR